MPFVRKDTKEAMSIGINEDKPIDRIWLVKKAYLVGLFGSSAVVVLGLLVAFLINHFYPLSDLAICLLQAFSVVPGSAALFGVGGWDLEWDGKSAAELLNQKLFIRLSLIGLFLPVMAFSLHSKVVEETTWEIESRILTKLKAELVQEYGAQIANTSSSIEERNSHTSGI